MDEALRRLERGDDPLAYATALRRAGDDVRARRVVEARVRAGDASAREMLDACWPLDPRVSHVVALALEKGRGKGRALTWLVGDEDPRVQPWLDELVRSCEHDRSPMDDALFAVATLRPEDRRRRILDQARDHDDVPLLTLSRVRPDGDEAAALLARAVASDAKSLLLAALWHAGAARAFTSATAVRTCLASEDPIVALEAALAMHALGDATVELPTPTSLPGRAMRPEWAVNWPAVEARDPLTGSWTRAAFLGESSAALDDPLLYVDLDRTRQINDVHGLQAGDRTLQAVTSALQVEVGDRVVRYGGDEWLVRLEPDLDERAVGERLRAAIAALSITTEPGETVHVTVSIGIGRAETWGETIMLAESACYAAKAAGRNAVREVT